MGIDQLATFSRMLNALARVERTIPMPGTERLENDLEHTGHLALIAWYLVDSGKLDLDLGRVLKYALAHDLVEVYAGDTYIYSTDTAHVESKKDRETEAARKLAQEFPEFPELFCVIEEYERFDNPESRFVYALDKIAPIIILREDKGRAWRARKVTLDMLLEKKVPQVAVSPEAKPYFDEIVGLIRDERLTAEFEDPGA